MLPNGFRFRPTASALLTPVVLSLALSAFQVVQALPRMDASGQDFQRANPVYALNPNQVELGAVLEFLREAGHLGEGSEVLFDTISRFREIPMPKWKFKVLLAREADRWKREQSGSYRIPPIKISSLRWAMEKAMSRTSASNLDGLLRLDSEKTPLAVLINRLKSPALTYSPTPPKDLGLRLQKGQTEAPLLTFGHPDHPGLSDDFKARSQVLAELLTRISEGESPTQFQSLDISKLVELLNLSGSVTLDRTIADFASLNFDGKSIVLPFWMETELRRPNQTQSYTLPMGHSQVTFHLSWATSNGRQVSTAVRFFLGTEGMKFYPMTSLRPRWTGYSVENLTSKKDELGTLLKFASGLIRRNRIESAGMPLDGYGFVGVCNDSTAPFLEVLAKERGFECLPRGSTFPVLRNQTLVQQGLPSANDGLNDWIDPIFRRVYQLRSSMVPRDHSKSRGELLMRSLYMMPATEKSVYETDPALAAEIEEMRREIGKQFPGCPELLMLSSVK